MRFRTYHLFGAMALMLLSFSCKMTYRALRYNKPDVTDHRLWPERAVATQGPALQFVDQTEVGLPDPATWALGKWYSPGMTEEDYFRKTGTVAFLVLHGDSLQYEWYANKYADTTRFNCFSMAKAYVSTLTGIAIEEGKIDSIDQSISDYLPWCRDSALSKITIRHLLQMTSGIKSSESFINPWATSTQLYYGDQVMDIIEHLELENQPGKRFDYININMQLLGMVLAEATGKPLGTYLQEKIWQPLGMEADAGWSLHEDSDLEKAFCCLNARARDYARFGLLMLRDGKWEGQQIVPETWMRSVVSLDTAQGARQRYQYNWYLDATLDDYYAQGLLGQYTYICPQTETVIVRLGNSLDYKAPWYDMFKILAGIAHKPVAMDFEKDDLSSYAGKWYFGISNFGDSSLYGKVADMEATNKGLKISTDFNKTWYALPETDTSYFNMKYARRLSIYLDDKGESSGMRWTRRGNSWKLSREKPKLRKKTATEALKEDNLDIDGETGTRSETGQ